MKNIFIISVIIISIIIVVDVFWSFKFTSNLILAITAIIVLWYTYETHLIRKSNSDIANANNELIKRSRRPSVGYRIYPLEKDPRETGFEIVNYSEHPVAVKVFCKFKLNNEIVKNEWPGYNGEEYWNLQFNQMKFGHFNILNLLKAKMGEDLINQLKKGDYFKDLVFTKEEYSSMLNSIEMEIQITTQNHLGDSIKYPIDHYKFDAKRKTWISTLTSKKPYWEES